jgi:hypothetical protein
MAATRKVTASKATAQPPPTAATATPAIGRPTMLVSALAALRREFADCWLPALMSCGTMPAIAGAVKAVKVPLATSSAMIIPRSLDPLIINPATAPCVTPDPRFESVSKRLREMRSATAPPRIMKQIKGMLRAAKTSPRALLLLENARTANPSPIGAMALPSQVVTDPA